MTRDEVRNLIQGLFELELGLYPKHNPSDIFAENVLANLEEAGISFNGLTEEPKPLTPEQIEAAALATQAMFNNYSEADIVSIEYKSISDLDTEYEHKMQMAAISSVSLANTKESLALINIGKESEFWSPAFDDVKAAIEREVTLREKVSKLKQLLLLTDPAVSSEQMNDLTMKQWAEFVKAFPDEGTT